MLQGSLRSHVRGESDRIHWQPVFEVAVRFSLHVCTHCAEAKPSRTTHRTSSLAESTARAARGARRRAAMRCPETVPVPAFPSTLHAQSQLGPRVARFDTVQAAHGSMLMTGGEEVNARSAAERRVLCVVWARECARLASCETAGRRL